MGALRTVEALAESVELAPTSRMSIFLAPALVIG